MAFKPGTYNPIGIRPGEIIELVRWALTDDGWQPITVSGQYLRLEENVWQIVKGDRVERYPADLWEVCVA